MSKHTQGPWSYWPESAYPQGVISEDATGGHVAIPTERFKMRANAYLMAAAPDLLEAAKEAEGVSRSPFHSPADTKDEAEAKLNRISEVLCAAIAKAERGPS